MCYFTPMMYQHRRVRGQGCIQEWVGWECGWGGNGTRWAMGMGPTFLDENREKNKITEIKSQKVMKNEETLSL